MVAAMNTGNTTDDHLVWVEQDRRVLVETPVFSLVESRRRSPEGRDSSYYLLDAPDWVNVIAVLDGQFVMVRQFRHGCSEVHLEFPGGVVDPREPPERAALREFMEETGYRCGELELLGSVNPNPALMGNRCHTYLVTDIHSAGDRDMDHDEYIDVVLVPCESLMYRPSEDLRALGFDHAMMHVALRMYEEREQRSRGALA